MQAKCPARFCHISSRKQTYFFPFISRKYFGRNAQQALYGASPDLICSILQMVLTDLSYGGEIFQAIAYRNSLISVCLSA